MLEVISKEKNFEKWSAYTKRFNERWSFEHLVIGATLRIGMTRSFCNENFSGAWQLHIIGKEKANFWDDAVPRPIVFCEKGEDAMALSLMLAYLEQPATEAQ